MKKTQLPIIMIIVLSLALAGFIVDEFIPDEDDHQVHYHANWAIFVNGQRAIMTDDKYMEPLVACQLDGAYVDPQQRVHMHENNHDVVHVHHPGVTWGHLMTNLDMTFGKDYFITDDGVLYYNQEGSTMKYILNGTSIPSPHNRVIDKNDQLLISYGPESATEVIQAQFNQLSTDAHEHNGKHDPASCSGE
jgi:hypothetical protein